MQKNIIYEDKHIIVAYKPAGIATQTAKFSQRDMVSELKNYLAGRSECKDRKEPYLGLVHRLDQPVTGILVFAKTKEAAASLSRQITDGRFHKYYYSVIYGTPPKEAGRLENYLYKDHRTNMSTIVEKEFPEAKKAALCYKLVKTLMVLSDMSFFASRKHFCQEGFIAIGREVNAQAVHSFAIWSMASRTCGFVRGSNPLGRARNRLETVGFKPVSFCGWRG